MLASLPFHADTTIANVEALVDADPIEGPSPKQTLALHDAILKSPWCAKRLHGTWILHVQEAEAWPELSQHLDTLAGLSHRCTVAEGTATPATTSREIVVYSPAVALQAKRSAFDSLMQSYSQSKQALRPTCVASIQSEVVAYIKTVVEAKATSNDSQCNDAIAVVQQALSEWADVRLNLFLKQLEAHLEKI